MFLASFRRKLQLPVYYTGSNVPVTEFGCIIRVIRSENPNLPSSKCQSSAKLQPANCGRAFRSLMLDASLQGEC